MPPRSISTAIYISRYIHLAMWSYENTAPNGSITYDSVIRSCGEGFLSVTALAVDEIGHAWIAGNTTACLAATPGALSNAHRR